MLVGNCLVDANKCVCSLVCACDTYVCGFVRGWDKPSAY